VTRPALDEMNCAIARTLDVIGDRWTGLILRDVSLGITRFDAIQRDLGISRRVLSERLAGMVEHGVLQRVPYQEAPTRYDYFPTEKGADLGLVLLAMQSWGNRWLFDDEAIPLLLRHEPCGHEVSPVLACPECGEELRAQDVVPVAGPGDLDGELPAALARWNELRLVDPAPVSSDE